MSSAALQSAPHQPTTVGSHSPIPATSSNRPYTAGSSQSRDQYYNQSPTHASPSSNRRPSRRPSGNGAQQSSNPPQSQRYPSSAGSSAARGAAPALSSPLTGSYSAAYQTMAPGDSQRGVPPIVSPRTSSSRNAAPSTDRSDRGKRTAYTNDTTSQRCDIDGQTERIERQRSDGNAHAANGMSGDDAAAAARARRRAQQPTEAVPYRPAGSREQSKTTNAAAASSSRQPGSGVTSPGDLSREASEVLNRVVVSKPEVDVERERERMAEATPSSPTGHQSPMGELSSVSQDATDETPRRSRHDYSTSGKREKNSKFGDYYLGNTLGEGEFGKVKMGWKQAGGVQVAIKLIRRDTVGHNPTRLAKIYREIAILREVSHPNIVKLHEMVETEKQIGIILEYASGGELFDYILNHRYLKDNAARKLFAQLISGVGYLHKKGIVHRDLKLENLLLDRNRNIIITDFGFANTFNSDDELGENVEENLSNREYVKRMELDKILPGGHRRGDLMQTSCGSPCYAAPELVVSDSLYTGRKVDVWSCGVILYAMLAGYLPFDDDPANPEGDNINLLYKYIVSTPLTFPEYVTPHARDLLRRILVPDPRKRADLFEVARHSWLSEYHNVVSFITSTTTTSGEISNASANNEDEDAPLLARSASVREPSKTAKLPTALGEIARKHGNVDPESEESYPKTAKDNKRRTVQVEYVAPNSSTVRGEPSTASAQKTRARSGSQGPQPGQANQPTQARRVISKEKPLPRDPPGAYSQERRPSSSRTGMAPPSRPGRDARATSDANYVPGGPPVSMVGANRPTTGGSMSSSRSGTLPNRGSYSQPAAPTVAGTNAHGRIAQPKSASNSYNIPALSQDETEYPQLSAAQVPEKFARIAGLPESAAALEPKGHKRSNTIGSLFSRTNSIFGGKKDKSEQPQEKPKKSYPPVSMSGTIGGGNDSRQSVDSRRSLSFGFNKKRSGSITGSQTTLSDKQTRRFSLLPSGFSLKSIGIGKEAGTPGRPPSDGEYESRPDNRGNYLDNPNPQYSRAQSQGRNVSNSSSGQATYTTDGVYDRQRDSPLLDRRGTSTTSPPQAHRRYSSQPVPDPRSGAPPQFLPPIHFRQDQSALNTESETSLAEMVNRPRGQYPAGFNERTPAVPRTNSSGRGVLTKNNRKFGDDYEPGSGYGATHNDHAGSSGAARKVMDFFRRRGKDRTEK
ncbi:hypothetical protein BJ878DRAFT_541219 [Calycina marina]|uniref:non-specific serine/threonine protein kinase n=1 Tax=Calycina marina TaxID=1763456 RepID=A0A9P7Z5G9_9HELO|nr:hypothetical protein BJ878DRAFT_541219 [Calycina marina]